LLAQDFRMLHRKISGQVHLMQLQRVIFNDSEPGVQAFSFSGALSKTYLSCSALADSESAAPTAVQKQLAAPRAASHRLIALQGVVVALAWVELFFDLVTNHAAHGRTRGGAGHTTTQHITDHTADYGAGRSAFFLLGHASAAPQNQCRGQQRSRQGRIKTSLKFHGKFLQINMGIQSWSAVPHTRANAHCWMPVAPRLCAAAPSAKD
jgi:hypothetical protein